MFADHLLNSGAIGLQAHHLALGEQVGTMLGEGRQHAVASSLTFAGLRAQKGLARLASLGVIAGHRQVIRV